MKYRIITLMIVLVIGWFIVGDDLYADPEIASVSEQVETIQEEPTPEPTIKATIENAKYIGNKNTGKFHKITCSFLPDEDNRLYFLTKYDVMQSYCTSPCEKCNP